MEYTIKPQDKWYHGSNIVFIILEKDSTITQWEDLEKSRSSQRKGMI